eukprot:CAMPEP_0202901518 /NCGR_PEP_ID=MMETSP1392-20130828/14296_1 /ASSEMBLY_ACC=CAM_ASM_000868 /TAXON_ID=225041 /ORGANISM="Chlamydomonas chlamydogama, Strain SAG 11-48b" /LENGTH=370 /DNA_ID=CAMNT_0049588089 /DNA_START=539 /DNA_END=1651 /DNA_ORIENTATION=-
MSLQQFKRAAELFRQHWQETPSAAMGTWQTKVNWSPFDDQVTFLVMEGLPRHISSAAAGAPNITHQHLTPDTQSSIQNHLDASSKVAQAEEALGQAEGYAAEHAEYNDAAAAAATGLPSHHLYDLHIVYHPSYQVPTLFLRGIEPGGRPLSWGEMQADWPHWGLLATQAGSDWAFIAPAPHPALTGHQQHGWCMVHPCQTAALLELLMQPEVQDACGDVAASPDRHVAHGFPPAGQEGSQEDARAAHEGSQEDAGQIPDLDDLLMQLQHQDVGSGLVPQEGRDEGLVGSPQAQAAADDEVQPASEAQGSATRPWWIVSSSGQVAHDADDGVLAQYMAVWWSLVGAVVGCQSSAKSSGTAGRGNVSGVACQ